LSKAGLVRTAVGMCEIHHTMWQAEEAMYAHLKQVTIRDIVESVNGKHPTKEVERGRQMVCPFLQSLR
jgi:DNA-binding IscR family transcriptional regulator